MNNTATIKQDKYQLNIKRKRQQPRHAIRRLLRSFKPLEPPAQRPATPQHSGGN